MKKPPERALGTFDASLLVVGCIVGAGIFLSAPPSPGTCTPQRRLSPPGFSGEPLRSPELSAMGSSEA